MSQEADYRLPRTVIPSRYELDLAPDLTAFEFTGAATVDVEVMAPVEEVVLNAADLQIDTVDLVDAAGTAMRGDVAYDPDAERAAFRFPQTVTPGKWKLQVTFRGTLNDQLQGFYRSTYRDPDGNERVLASTQFEATDARRAFPCWDEPDLKATFAVSLTVAAGLVAISNGPEIGTEPVGDGRVRHRFGETMKMSTYLVAFVVGDLEATAPVDAGGIPLRVLHTPGKGDLAGFALEVGAFALDYFRGYYGIPYPAEKLDLLAIPDFAWGAMENLGAVTFRESALLVDQTRATPGELARVADVIAHELAHMWFGDLVTMKWWNGIWLNEAFATFMELKCVDAFRPTWKRWLSFCDMRAEALDVDGLTTTRPVEFPVASPAEANQMFDTLTYRKGSAVLRMLERYLGEDTFRRGIGRYLTAHAYGNTDTGDLWEALEAESGEPVGELMAGWILTGGYPQLDVTAIGDGYRIEQHQFRYVGGGDASWQVPARYRRGTGEERVIITDSLVLPRDDGFLLNSGGDGFYRVRYAPELLAALAARLPTLLPAERYAILSDTWANVLSGSVPAAAFIDLAGSLRDDPEPYVWGVALRGLAELGRVVSSDDRPRFEAMVRDRVGPAAARLGWVVAAGDSDLTRTLRGLLLRSLGTLGNDESTRKTAREVFERAVAGDAMDGDVAAAAVAITGADGSPADFERFLDLWRKASTPQDEIRYLGAAVSVPDPATADRLIRMVLNREIRSHDATWVLPRLLGHRDTGEFVWGRLKDEWEAILAVLPPQTRRRVLDNVMYRSEPAVAADIENWLAEHPIEGAELHTAQQLERLRVRVGLREREASRLGTALS